MKKQWKKLARKIAKAALKSVRHLAEEERERRVKAFCRAVKGLRQ